jgi:hypothetical protein
METLLGFRIFDLIQNCIKLVHPRHDDTMILELCPELSYMRCLEEHERSTTFSIYTTLP